MQKHNGSRFTSIIIRAARDIWPVLFQPMILRVFTGFHAQDATIDEQMLSLTKNPFIICNMLALLALHSIAKGYYICIFVVTVHGCRSRRRRGQRSILPELLFIVPYISVRLQIVKRANA